jgi:hypothetical protein
MTFTRNLTIPLLVTLAVGYLSIGFALGAAEGQGSWLGIPESISNVVLILAFFALIAAQIYSVWNRKNYETRDATIKDLNALLAAREAIVSERDRTLIETTAKHEARLEALVAGHDLELKELRTEIRRLKANNTALTDVNLTAIAELTKLRQAGVWDGNEREIFRSSGLSELGGRDQGDIGNG